jgi:hypothetical protein
MNNKKTDSGENIKDLVKQLAKRDEEDYSILCKVESVNEEKGTCTANPVNGEAPILRVKLRTEKDGAVLLIPEKDSFIVCSFLSKNEAYVSMFGKISKVIITNSSSFDIVAKGALSIDSGDDLTVSTKGSAKISVEKDFTMESKGDIEISSNLKAGLSGKSGIHLIGKELSLKTQLIAILDAISILTVPTSTGVSGTPANATQFQQIKAKLNMLFDK